VEEVLSVCAQTKQNLGGEGKCKRWALVPQFSNPTESKCKEGLSLSLDGKKHVIKINLAVVAVSVNL
jgi:hypothetical protein